MAAVAAAAEQLRDAALTRTMAAQRGGAVPTMTRAVWVADGPWRTGVTIARRRGTYNECSSSGRYRHGGLARARATVD